MKSPQEILSGYARPGEQIVAAIRGKEKMSKGGTAAATVLAGPTAMAGVEAIIGLSDRALVYVYFNFVSHLLKPKSAKMIEYADIADCEVAQKSFHTMLHVLKRDGKKVHFELTGKKDETGAFIQQFQQFRQQVGFSAQAVPQQPMPQPVQPPPQPQPPVQAPPPAAQTVAPPLNPQPAPPPQTPHPPPQFPPPVANSATVACRSCGQATDANGRFCENCGQSLAPPQPRTCGSCGRELKPTAKFCSGCGNRAAG